MARLKDSCRLLTRSLAEDDQVRKAAMGGEGDAVTLRQRGGGGERQKGQNFSGGHRKHPKKKKNKTLGREPVSHPVEIHRVAPRAREKRRAVTEREKK